MRYTSTRNDLVSVSASEAIAAGLAPDGGLFLPVEIPKLDAGALDRLMKMSYPERAAYIMGMYLDEFTAEELDRFARETYSEDRFPGGPAPLHAVGEHWMLELWHGPTCAFKDMALQMLPRLLGASLRKTGQSETALILTATSGDTGKAALEGFADVPGTKIMVFYPAEGVSRIQQLQMTTQTGQNVCVKAVCGNFDDTQTGVKNIFSDENMQREVAVRGCRFSSANSINWGRLLPQIAYYVSAWCDLAREGKTGADGAVNFCVPTGNFGNILAAWYAREMGVPIRKLICASNSNNVLTDFIRTGVYDRRREFFTTSSPSMDILISSNLERLLRIFAGSDIKVKTLMNELKSKGEYTVGDDVKKYFDELFWADWCSDEETLQTIAQCYNEHGYLIDPHTAVAENVMQKYFTLTGDRTPAVVVSTASPYKFCGSVLEALGVGYSESDDLIARLEEVTGVPAPLPLVRLRDAKERFTDVIGAEKMADEVLEFAAKK